VLLGARAERIAGKVPLDSVRRAPLPRPGVIVRVR
jgi:hypothetical protein